MGGYVRTHSSRSMQGCFMIVSKLHKNRATNQYVSRRL